MISRRGNWWAGKKVGGLLGVGDGNIASRARLFSQEIFMIISCLRIVNELIIKINGNEVFDNIRLGKGS